MRGSKAERAAKSDLAKRNLYKFMTNRLAILGLALVLLILFVSLLAPVLTPYEPNVLDTANRYQAPSREHLLGTDQLGRDLLTRLFYGGRVSIFVGFVSAVVTAALGVALGCISGYLGKRLDSVIVYISEIFTAFPQMLLIFILVGFVGQGIGNLIFIFALTGWTSIYRLVRSRIFSLKEEPFIDSCRANGISNASIMFRHMLPNTIGPVIVNVTLLTAGYLLQESALSFLNIGVPTDIPTWGNILNAAKNLNVIQNYPVMWIGPGVAISLFVLGVNFLGDGLRDVLDPT